MCIINWGSRTTSIMKEKKARQTTSVDRIHPNSSSRTILLKNHKRKMSISGPRMQQRIALQNNRMIWASKILISQILEAIKLNSKPAITTIQILNLILAMPTVAATWSFLIHKIKIRSPHKFKIWNSTLTIIINHQEIRALHNQSRNPIHHLSMIIKSLRSARVVK